LYGLTCGSKKLPAGGSRILLGYRPKDHLILNKYPLPAPDEVGMKMRVESKPPLTTGRRAQACTLPVYLGGAVYPHPDCNWPEMLRNGAKYRAGRKLPPVNIENFWERFQLFVKDTILPEFFGERLDYDEEINFEEWLSKTNYPEWRKEELRKVYDDMFCIEDKNNFIVKLFMKDEFYPGIKHGRGIYARVDEAKVIFGPVVKKIEEIVYQHPAFVKHVPVDKRPSYIYERLYSPGSKYLATDYSSFEAHMSKEMFQLIEYFIYRQFVGQTNTHMTYVLNLMEKIVSGKNIIRNKYFSGYIHARRMSGEMTTSLGNGLINYCLMKFACHLQGIDTVGVVEGDDGLFAVGQNVVFDPIVFRDMGCLVKLDEHNRLETAGFCQNVFDIEERINIVDPIKILCNFGWCQTKYIHASQKTKMKLLRVKALSMLFQCAGCPIVHVLAERLLYLTRSYNLGKLLDKAYSGFWERQLKEGIEALNVQEKLNVSISSSSRMLMSEKFGISPSAQLAIENSIKSWSLGLNVHSLILLHVPDVCVDMYNEYSFEGDGREIEYFNTTH
jgi:hypothetical protein